ncbi:MAG: hypothetical protein H7X91_10335 [Burkholderiales bacterium]|nr:hypothetical protein [Burkholderiales bacterium]
MRAYPRAILTQQWRLIAELADRNLAGGCERLRVLTAVQRTLKELGSETRSLLTSLRAGVGKQQEKKGA